MPSPPDRKPKQGPEDPASRPPGEPWKICLIVHTTAGQAHAVREEIEAQTGGRMSWWSRADARQ